MYLHNLHGQGDIGEKFGIILIFPRNALSGETSQGVGNRHQNVVKMDGDVRQSLQDELHGVLEYCQCGGDTEG